MKIAVLYEVWEGREEYPGENDDERTGRKRRRPKLDREEIFDALTKLGHEPCYLVLDGREQSLFALAKAKVDLFFNLTESYGGDDRKDMHVAAYLDLLGVRYTGSGPHALHLAQDKGLAKKIIRFHDLHTPFSAVSYKGMLDHAHDVNFPLIVKPTSEDGSIGIDSGSVVNSVKELMERIHYIHHEFDSPALIEEFIPGREIYGAVIGNDNPTALPPVELDLSGLPEGVPRIAGWDVKYERSTEAYKKTKSKVAEDLDQETVERLQKVAVTVYQALKLRDYGRIDMRMREDGRIYVIEANPNPWLSSGAEFMMAARAAGRTYVQTVGELVDVAMKRY
jgi:D-alanine-D-alanine ligase